MLKILKIINRKIYYEVYKINTNLMIKLKYLTKKIFSRFKVVTYILLTK